MNKKFTLKDKLISEAIDFFKIDSLLDADNDENTFFDDDDENDTFFDLDEPFFDNDDENDTVFDDDDEYDTSGKSHEDDEFMLDDPEEPDYDDEYNDNDNDNDNDVAPEGDTGDDGGLIRTVRGAYMVFKRLTPSNNYEELWIYNLTNVKAQTKIRNAILSGTDIDPISLMSIDREQKATTYSKGNVQFLHIDGLPN